ncbi:MAG: amidohydrolase family protein [Myxococcota bacterium]|jgi:predicted TIM-barrel fold metal-dependent hydrolase|nr:amidohydrolase family protein [Myxococcota bacterium]
MRLDTHVHLLALDSPGFHFSKRYRKSLIISLLRRRLGLQKVADSELLQAYLAQLLAQLEASPAIDAVVLLALDFRYDQQGRPDLEQTPFAVSNDAVFDACAQDSRLLPGASLNPQRADALDALEELAERGSVLIKTLPNVQDFDPAEPRYRPIWRRMAELSLPMLCHTGREHTIPSTKQSYGDPSRWIPALEEGLTVIAAHAGTSGPVPGHETFYEFLGMMKRFPRLYGDLSALTNLSRASYLPKLLKQPELFERMLYGSDYPVPSSPLRFWPRLPLSTVRRIGREGSLLSTASMLFDALGVPDSIYTRASELLRLGPRELLRAIPGTHPSGLLRSESSPPGYDF